MQYDSLGAESAALPAVAGHPGRAGECPPAATAASSRLSLWRLNFGELYQRHLCRHSQFGINVSHLATVVGCYVGVFVILSRWLAPALLMIVPAVYVVTLAVNVPARVLTACAWFLVLFFALFSFLPPMPVWLPLAIILPSHQAQNWSHRWWNKEQDMTEFNRVYPKGPLLFVVLSLYELPILLNYLLFGRKDWTA